MDLQGMMAWVIPFLTVANIIITWINSKSKKDIASATEMTELKSEVNELRNELKNKVDAIRFTEVVGKIDALTDMVKDLMGKMHSVLNDSNTNSTQIEVSQTKIVAIEARLKKHDEKLEAIIEKLNN